MKSTMKKLTAVILVLVLTLSLFAGCSGSSVKTSDEYLLSEYGMTFSGSSATYDGSAHSISVSATTTSGYSVSYSYLSGSTEVSTAGVTDAGTYEVVATITETDGEIYYLSEEITISPAKLSVSVPDQYIRTGSDADDVEDIFEDIELLGSDTVKSIGMAWDVANIDDIDAMDDISDGKALGVTITSDNYTLSVSKGTLYVLSYADYTAVTTLKLDVTNLEAYGERFDELTYTENSAYISAAGRVLDVFENEDDYTSIQVAMMGSVSESEITANLATAQERKIQGYELDWDVANEISTGDLSVDDDDDIFGAVAVVAGYASGVASTDTIEVEDDDDETTDEARFYIDNGFLIDYDGRDDEDTYDDYEEAVMYGDYFYFVMNYYDNDSYENAYVIENLLVRNKETNYSDYTLIYKYSETNEDDVYLKTELTLDDDGNVDDNSSDYDDYSYEGTFAVYKLRADSSTIGALGAGTTIDITIIDIAKYNLKFDTTDTDTNNDVVYSMNISGDTNGTIFNLNNFKDVDKHFTSDEDDVDYEGLAGQAYFEANDDAGYVTVGEEVTLTIYMEDGYYISQILIGEYEIDGSDIVGDKVTFTVEEDMFGEDAGDTAVIEVYTGKSYDIGMKINNRTVRSTTGEYEGTSGTVEIDGSYLSGSTVYVIEGTTLDLTFAPDDNYSVSSVKMYFDEVEWTSSNSDDFEWDTPSGGDTDDLKDGYSGGASIELIDEVSSNKISIDLSEDCDYFDFDDIGAATSVTFLVEFAESWTFSVESDDVVFKENAAGEFVSDYGTISILDYDDEIMTSALSGDYFMVYAELEPGYYISSLKINNSTKTIPGKAGDTSSTAAYKVLTSYMYDSIDDGEMYFFNASADYTSDPSFGDTDDKIKESDLYLANYSSLDAGEAIVIEVEFGTYYELSLENDADKVKIVFDGKSTNTAFYQMSTTDDTIIIFGDDDSKTASLTATFDASWWVNYFKDHTGLTATESGGVISMPSDTSDAESDIDYVYYFFEVENTIVNDDIDFKGGTFAASKYTAYDNKTTSETEKLDFDELFALVSPGDEIVIYFYDDVEYE
ncbi:MAG: MBG domain-containing protein [Bacillota bacterium]